MLSLANIQKNKVIILMMFMGAIFSLVNQSVAQEIVIDGNIDPVEAARSNLIVSFDGVTSRPRISIGVNGDLLFSGVNPSFFLRGHESFTVTITVPSDGIVNSPARTGEFWARTSFSSVTVSVVHVDNDTAGFATIPSHETSTLTINEGGTAETFAVRLNQLPANFSDTVVLSVSSSDTAVATVVPALLTFTRSNWNAPIPVTVTPRAANVDDTDDGNFMVTVAVVDEDSIVAYDGLPDKIFNGMVLNLPEIVTNPVSVIDNIDEGDPFPINGFVEISLSRQPASDVVVSVIFSDPSRIAVSRFGGQTKLTFTSRNWNAAQAVNLEAQEDTDTVDNDYTITLDVISGPAGYVALDNKELTGTIIDNDTPGFTLSTDTLGSISEGAAAGRDFTVVLDLVPAPLASVELTVHTASGPVECG